ncbi:MAG: ATP-binding protein [Tepidisphaeraceae bacterium]
MNQPAQPSREPAAPGPARPRRGLSPNLAPGEHLAGMLSATLAATLFVALVTMCAAWVLSERRQLAHARATDTLAFAQTLARGAEQLLHSGEITATRSLLMFAASDAQLREARIVLADGAVIADRNPAMLRQTTLRDTWPTGDFTSTAASDPEWITIPLDVPGRGKARLEIVPPLHNESSRTMEIVSVSGLVAALGLGCVWAAHRQFRRRLVAIGRIQQSLQSLVSEGATALERIHPDAGPEALPWNELVSLVERTRKSELNDKVRATLLDRRESGSDLDTAVDGLTLGMVLLDDMNRVRHLNGAAAGLLRVDRNAVTGRPAEELFTDDALRELVAGGAPGRFPRKTTEIKLSDGGSETILRVHVRPIRRGDAGNGLITLEDVTQQRLADASRDAFVAQATHELRTPLTNMRLCLEEVIEEQASLPPDFASHVNVLNTETRRLERIVSDMLSVAEIEAGTIHLRVDDVKFDRLFGDARATFAPQAQAKGLSLDFDLPPKWPIFRGDREKIVLGVHNLIGNALKYTPAGGHVRVRVEQSTTQFTVAITDTGIGISKEDQGRLFQRFNRAKDPRVAKQVGSGLGLALARSIARLHGGDITVVSELNKGSTFTLTLPLDVSANAPTKAAA